MEVISCSVRTIDFVYEARCLKTVQVKPFLLILLQDRILGVVIVGERVSDTVLCLVAAAPFGKGVASVTVEQIRHDHFYVRFAGFYTFLVGKAYGMHQPV